MHEKISKLKKYIFIYIYKLFFIAIISVTMMLAFKEMRKICDPKMSCVSFKVDIYLFFEIDINLKIHKSPSCLTKIDVIEQERFNLSSS